MISSTIEILYQLSYIIPIIEILSTSVGTKSKYTEFQYTVTQHIPTKCNNSRCITYKVEGIQ